MNTIWSDYVQGIGTLYSSRVLRFSDDVKYKYIKAFMLEEKKKILEIGCGPGALGEALSRWYPDALITGVDRDSNFIEFANKKAPHISFLEGDAADLPFENESFDAAISNTVAEHIKPSEFYKEQYRVLKEGGVCLVLSARKGIIVNAPCSREQTDFEKNIWQRTKKFYDDIFCKNRVCAYPQNEAEIPANMEKYGFRNVTTEYITINLTPDNPNNSRETAYAMIDSLRQGKLDNAEALKNIEGEAAVEPWEIEELKRLINEKYNKRLELYDKGVKQWDTHVSVTMIVRGVKQ